MFLSVCMFRNDPVFVFQNEPSTAYQAMAKRAAVVASGRHSVRCDSERLRECGAVAACLSAAAGG